MLTALALPVIFARLWWRGRRLPAYRQRWSERLGRIEIQPKAGPRIWLHAVSVGETVAAAGLAQRLLDDGFELLITCGTPTGSAEIRRRFEGRCQHCYAPLDYPPLIRRFLRSAAPDLAIIIETEVWPNWLRECRRHGIATLLANARLSARSARRYQLLPGFARSVFRDFTAIAAQTEADAERLRALGVAAHRVTVTGSIKYDVELTLAQRNLAADLRAQLPGRWPVVCAASTHSGEDAQVLQAFQPLLAEHPSALLLLVPRHPDRFEEVFELCAAEFQVARRSGGQAPGAAQILLGDTMGELIGLMGAANWVFVGGSLVPRGGHNPIEPALWERPICMGPYCFNFAGTVAELKAAKALTQVRDGAELAAHWQALAARPEAAEAAGRAARRWCIRGAAPPPGCMRWRAGC